MSRPTREFRLTAVPLDERMQAIEEDRKNWVAYDPDVLVGDVSFREWLEARSPGEAFDMTLEIVAFREPA
jgi:hypothetical protein